jgi:hypothetical protein
MTKREVGERPASGSEELLGELAFDGTAVSVVAPERRGDDSQVTGDLFTSRGELGLPSLDGEQDRLMIRGGLGQGGESPEIGIGDYELVLEDGDISVRP